MNPMTCVAAGLLMLASPPDVHTPPDSRAVLAGPKVPTAAAESLVSRGSDGAIQRTDVPPEVAALRLLTLTPDVRARIDELLLARGRLFEDFIANNLELLGKLDTAGNTGDKADQAILGLEALAKLAPLRRDGSLRSQIRAALPPDALKHFDRLLAEYWDAIIAQEKSRDPKKHRFGIMVEERAASFLREATAAYERLEKSGTLLFRYFFDAVELTPEQQGAIRALLDEFVEETEGAPTKQQEQKIFFAVMSQLDTKQQTALIRAFKAREKPEAASRPTAPPTDAPSPAASDR